jgi:uncharacterized protein YoxC
MSLPFDFSALLQSGVIRDTIVTLLVPEPRTAFDYASGTLQILVLIVGLIALGAMGALSLTLRKSVMALQATVDRLAVDVKPLLHQATRVSEDAHDIVKTVRREVDRIADATAEVSERLLDLSDAAENRIDSVNALLDVMQDEVQDTAISAAATLRGARVGAAALGAVLGLRGRDHTENAPADDSDELDDNDDALYDELADGDEDLDDESDADLDDDFVDGDEDFEDDAYDGEDEDEEAYDLDDESEARNDTEMDDTSHAPKRKRP